MFDDDWNVRGWNVRSWLSALVLVSALFALAPTTANAAPSRPPLGVPSFLNQQVTSTHFVVHYTETQGNVADRLSTADATAL